MPLTDALVKLSDKDNVVVALTDIERGAVKHIEGEAIVTRVPLTLGQKIASRDIAKGEPILKYGLPIGVATLDIAKGEHVHVHNIASNYTKTHSLSQTSSGQKGAVG